MNHWLMKSEPSVFGIEDLARLKRDRWEGVRNYQARNFMREMSAGDLAFLYHSSCNEPGIVGIMKIAKAAYPDGTAFDRTSKYFDPGSDAAQPRWCMVDVSFERKLKRIVSLAELKSKTELADLALVRRGNRLSVMPVSAEHWRFILSLERAGGNFSP
jgi:predicted RNA-binding protein with PUA-like domain